jgi:hypothetical protein
VAIALMTGKPVIMSTASDRFSPAEGVLLSPPCR